MLRNAPPARVVIVDCEFKKRDGYVSSACVFPVEARLEEGIRITASSATGNQVLVASSSRFFQERQLGVPAKSRDRAV